MRRLTSIAGSLLAAPAPASPAAGASASANAKPPASGAQPEGTKLLQDLAKSKDA